MDKEISVTTSVFYGFGFISKIFLKLKLTKKNFLVKLKFYYLFIFSSSSSRRDSSSTAAATGGSGSSLSRSNSKQEVRSRKSSISSAPSPKDVDKKTDKNTRMVRDMTTKGFKDALKLKLAKQDENDVKMEDDKLEDLVKVMEKELYLLYNRDAGTKYKAKYR